MVLPKTLGNPQIPKPAKRISDWEVPQAAGYHDVYVGRQADNPEGKPGDSGARRLSLPILRAGRKSQFCKRPGDARGLCRSAREEGQEESDEPGGLLRSV